MLPLQILFLNLIYDISCVSIPWDHMDKEYLDKPKRWNASSIGNFMIWLGPTSSVFDITTYLLMYFIICPAVVGGDFHTLTPEQQVAFIAVFHAGWFVESLWSQNTCAPRLANTKDSIYPKPRLIHYDSDHFIRNCRRDILTVYELWPKFRHGSSSISVLAMADRNHHCLLSLSNDCQTFLHSSLSRIALTIKSLTVEQKNYL